MSQGLEPLPPLSPEELDRLLRAQDWQTVRARLFDVARRRAGSRSQAEELADAVIVDCCDPLAAPWNPREQPDLVKHALYVLRDRLSAERKKQQVRNNPKNVATVLELGPRAPTPEQTHEDAARQARDDRILSAARDRLRDPLDRAVLDLILEDVDKPAEQASRLGRPIEDIRRARERVKYAVRAATDEDEAS